MLLRNQLKSGGKNLKKMAKYLDDEINPKHWYIASLIMGVPRLYPRFFKTEKEVLSFMKINKINHIHFIHIRGKRALGYDLKFYKRSVNLYSLINKMGQVIYSYPPDRIKRQDKKSFRTKSRRWKRDYNKLPDNHTDFKSFR